MLVGHCGHSNPGEKREWSEACHWMGRCAVGGRRGGVVGSGAVGKQGLAGSDSVAEGAGPVTEKERMASKMVNIEIGP